MRPGTWYPAPGMRFLVPNAEGVEGDRDVAEVLELNGGLNDLCRCRECPCFFVAIDGYAGQFSLDELRRFEFAPGNTITESGPEPVRLPNGFHGYLHEGDAVQGAML